MVATAAPAPDAATGGHPLGSSLPAILLARREATPDRVAMRKKHLGRWRAYTWREYADRAAAIGDALVGLGVGEGDRVAIHSQNRPAWLLADLAVQGIGAVSVGIYPTSPAAEVEYLLDHSESVLLFAEDEEQVDKVLAVWEKLPALRTVVVVDPRGVDLSDDRVMTLAELEQRGRDEPSDFSGRVGGIDPRDPAIIVYTSGTTGPPKGAMLSHANLLAAAVNAGVAFEVDERGEVLSYLPLCHVAERLVSGIDAVATGYVVNFGEAAETFLQDLREVQPTFFLGVPRVWEKLMAGITIKMADAGRIKRANYDFWMKRGAKIARRRWKGRMGLGQRLVYGMGWLLLYRQLREKIGMTRVRGALSGAAPIAPQVLEFFWSLGVPVREGYGQTENTAQATVNPGDDVRIGTVGVAVPGTELSHRRRRRDPDPRPRDLPRLPEEPRGDSRDDRRGRLAAHGRRRCARRRWLPDDHRPQEGHHHHRRRQEHQPVGDREQAQGQPVRARGSGHR